MAASAQQAPERRLTVVVGERMTARRRTPVRHIDAGCGDPKSSESNRRHRMFLFWTRLTPVPCSAPPPINNPI
jgi:hypothetical protein